MRSLSWWSSSYADNRMNVGGRMSPWWDPAGARRPVNRKCRRTNEPIWLPYCRPPISAISAIKQSLPGQSLRRRGTFGFWPHCLIGIFGTRRIIAIALNQLDDLTAYLCLSKTLRWIGGKFGKSNSCLMGSEVPRVRTPLHKMAARYLWH